MSAPKPSPELSKVRSEHDIAAASEMVWAYFDTLRQRSQEMTDLVDRYIETHDVASELDDFADHFTPPAGECVQARLDGEMIGIVMLTRQTDGICEMNRMFVTDAARGLGVGRKLCRAVVREARMMGFRQMILDTMFFLTEAIALYKSEGFEEYIDATVYDPDDTRLVHMRKSLVD